MAGEVQQRLELVKEFERGDVIDIEAVHEDEVEGSDSERRQQIVDAVIKCITEDGVDGATIRKVADRVGGSTGMVTHYFPNKKELIKESLTVLTERSIAKVDDWVGGSFSAERMNVVADLTLRNPGGDAAPASFWLWAWSEATRDPDLRQVLAANQLRTREILTSCAQAGIEDGQVRADIDPELIADAVNSIITGLRIRMVLLPEIISPERALQIAQLLLNALRPVPSPSK